MTELRTPAVVVDVVRTPMGKGKPGGALHSLHPVELLAQTLTSLLARTGVDPGTVDDVLVGCVSQSGEQSATPGRMAWLAAGFPAHVPSMTLERKCGSGQQAIEFAAQSIVAGVNDVVIAAGVESMSRVPMGSSRGTADPAGPSVKARFPALVPQGVAAERVAERYGIGRPAQDEFSLASHRRAHAAATSGGFDNEIVPVTLDDGMVVSADETIRPGTSLEQLAALRPAFRKEPYTERLPGHEWTVTPGNSSQLTDGASAVLLMSEERAHRLGLTPRARLLGGAVCGDDPELMLTGPIPATRKVLARTGLELGDIDVFEVNEAFASVPLAWAKEFGVDLGRVNPCGGAIALGHPLGASGCRIFTTMLNHLERTGGRLGLQTMCEAGGMANATVVERLS
ncbi:steroid 3-ketoacyl-CoA thiolase [Amycolatopsis sp. WAC 04197]|uniref:thiolase family protein n=1 Tax=Amycolatopsis sp. WAC 04197 TaxID=2203199 RepID=UPI000F78B8F7|nr:thiolase family protein [Amycolatopsis sp. WAC 04197]RSN45159.1 steroid 3-ketoacyl-CoA thiolase [Amycolatopsis sp. WAC 04197]